MSNRLVSIAPLAGAAAAAASSSNATAPPAAEPAGKGRSMWGFLSFLKRKPSVAPPERAAELLGSRARDQPESAKRGLTETPERSSITAAATSPAVTRREKKKEKEMRARSRPKTQMPPPSAPLGWTRARLSPSKLVAVEPGVVLQEAERDRGVLLVPDDEQVMEISMAMEEGPTYQMPAPQSRHGSHQSLASQPSSDTHSEIEELVFPAQLATPSVSSNASSPFAELQQYDTPPQLSRSSSPQAVGEPLLLFAH